METIKPVGPFRRTAVATTILFTSLFVVVSLGSRVSASRATFTFVSPAPPVAADIKAWHRLFVTTAFPVNELPLSVPETSLFDVFTFSEAAYFAQEPFRPTPETPATPELLTIEQRALLRRFLYGRPGSRHPHFGASDLFINGPDEEVGHDLIGNASRIQAVRRSAGAWANNELQLSKEYDRLIRFKWLPANSPGAAPQPDVPANMTAYVRAEYQRLRGNLAPELRQRLNGWAVETSAPPDPPANGESLWIKVNHGRRVLWVSPQLLRTFFLQAVQEELKAEYPQLLQNSNLIPRGLDKPELVAQVGQRFEGSVRAVLAHLMAHVYVDVTGIAEAERESRYDQAAAQALGAGPALRQVTFRSTLNRAIKMGEDEDWGVEQPNDREAVRARLGT